MQGPDPGAPLEAITQIEAMTLDEFQIGPQRDRRRAAGPGLGQGEIEEPAGDALAAQRSIDIDLEEFRDSRSRGSGRRQRRRGSARRPRRPRAARRGTRNGLLGLRARELLGHEAHARILGENLRDQEGKARAVGIDGVTDVEVLRGGMGSFCAILILPRRRGQSRTGGESRDGRHTSPPSTMRTLRPNASAAPGRARAAKDAMRKRGSCHQWEEPISR